MDGPSASRPQRTDNGRRVREGQGIRYAAGPSGFSSIMLNARRGIRISTSPAGVAGAQALARTSSKVARGLSFPLLAASAPAPGLFDGIRSGAEIFTRQRGASQLSLALYRSADGLAPSVQYPSRLSDFRQVFTHVSNLRGLEPDEHFKDFALLREDVAHSSLFSDPTWRAGPPSKKPASSFEERGRTPAMSHMGIWQ
jgi:hypothetical protein